MLTRSDAKLEEVRAFMRKHRLTGDDLADYGGAELKSPNRRIADRARAVEQCWELMARLGVRAEQLSPEPPRPVKFGTTGLS